jgi:putative glycosyltransferase (TIGR04372 family)
MSSAPTLEALKARFDANPEGYEENRDLALWMSGQRAYQRLAEPHIRTALAHGRDDPASEDLLYTLAVIETQEGNFEAAWQIYSDLRQRHPGNPYYLFCMGDMRFRLGDLGTSSQLCGNTIDWYRQFAETRCRERGEPVTQLIAENLVIWNSFGEMAAKLDLFVKAKALGYAPETRAILLAPEGEVTNQFLLDCWHPYVEIVTDPAEIARLQKAYEDHWLLLDYYRMPDGTCLQRFVAYPLVQRRWEEEGRAPLLSLDADVIERGRAVLAKLGVPRDAWFACLHVRDPVFFDEEVASNPNRYRNADIGTFAPAIEAIVERGGWVVRLGTEDFTPMEPMDNVVDYAMTADRSDWMDVVCLSQCRFLLAGESGPVYVANAFGVPLVGVNWFPPGMWPLSRQDIFVPKRLHLAAEGRDLSINEAIQAPFFGMPFPNLYDSRGIEVIDSTPDDIKDAVVEMLDRLDGGMVYSSEDEALQNEFREQADLHGGGVPCRIAMAYLKRHPELSADRSGTG